MRNYRRVSGLLGLVLLAGVLLAGCNGPTDMNQATNAAIVDGQTITMSQYLSTVRVLDALQRVRAASSFSGVSPATWQLPAGRTTLATEQQLALLVLISDVVLAKQALKLGIPAKTIEQAENAALTQDFSNLQAPFKPLVDGGILTRDTYRPLENYNILLQQVPPKITASLPIAHVRILTVSSAKTADALRTQLHNGADWATLAQKQSTDPTRAIGGDIAVLPQGALPPELDQDIFGTESVDPKALKKADPNKIDIVPSSWGYTLVQVFSTSMQPFTSLDPQTPVVPNGRYSVAGLALYHYLDQLAADSAINVNWCNAVNGQQCGRIFFLGL